MNEVDPVFLKESIELPYGQEAMPDVLIFPPVPEAEILHLETLGFKDFCERPLPGGANNHRVKPLLIQHF